MNKIFAILVSSMVCFGALNAQDEIAPKTWFDMGKQWFKAGEYDKAYNVFNKECDNGVQRSCAMKGIMLFNGQGVKRDTAAAEALFKKACDTNYAMACEKLGEMYASGIAVDKSSITLELIQSLFKKACDGGYEPACDLAK